MRVAAVLVVGRHHVRPVLPDHPDQRRDLLVGVERAERLPAGSSQVSGGTLVIAGVVEAEPDVRDAENLCGPCHLARSAGPGCRCRRWSASGSARRRVRRRCRTRRPPRRPRPSTWPATPRPCWTRRPGGHAPPSAAAAPPAPPRPGRSAASTVTASAPVAINSLGRPYVRPAAVRPRVRRARQCVAHVLPSRSADPLPVPRAAAGRHHCPPLHRHAARRQPDRAARPTITAGQRPAHGAAATGRDPRPAVGDGPQNRTRTRLTVLAWVSRNGPRRGRDVFCANYECGNAPRDRLAVHPRTPAHPLHRSRCSDEYP